MFKLIRWTALGLVLLGGLGYLAFGSSFTSYGKGFLSRVQSEAQEMVPLELELDRAQVALRDAESQIADNRKLHAETAVSVEDLESEIQQLDRRKEESLTGLRLLREAFDATGRGSRQVALYRGRRVEADDVARRLRAAVVRGEALQQQLAMKQELLEARRRHLEDLEATLLAAESQRDRLQIQLETRRVELECAHLAGAASATVGTPTGLAEAKSALDRVDREVRVMKRLTGLTATEADLDWLQWESNAESVAARADRLLGAGTQEPDENEASSTLMR